LPGKARRCNLAKKGDVAVDADEPRKKPSAHDIGMVLDSLSIEELEMRIGLLKEEIVRLEAAIAAKQKSRSAADSVFKR
jgi:uncharacterized small protein (DUF1192 family)